MRIRATGSADLLEPEATLKIGPFTGHRLAREREPYRKSES
jgi:hypothetical protein